MSAPARENVRIAKRERVGAVEQPLDPRLPGDDGLGDEEGMARPQTLIARNREGVQRLDPKGLRLLEDRPRTGLRLLDEDLSERRRTGILPLAGGREEAARVRHERLGLGVVRHRGRGVRGQRLALCRHGIRRSGTSRGLAADRWGRRRAGQRHAQCQRHHSQGLGESQPAHGGAVSRRRLPRRPDRRRATWEIVVLARRMFEVSGAGSSTVN